MSNDRRKGKKRRHPREKLGVDRIYPIGTKQEFDNLRRHVDRIIFAGDLLLHEKPDRGTTGLILLDQIAEALMYSAVLEEIRGDEFYSRIVPPKLSRKQRTELLWQFDKKIEHLRASGYLREEDAVVLAVGHEYRNPAYHRDESDGARDRIMAGLLIPSIAALLEATYTGVSLSIDEHGEWVAQFLSPTPSFAELGSVAAAAGSWLANKYCPDIEGAAKILAENIEGRLGNLARLIEDDLYPALQERVDEFLAEEEFLADFDNETAEAPLRKVKYAIVAEQEVTGEQYIAAEERYLEAVRSAKAVFVPKVSTEGLNQLRKEPEGLLGHQTRFKLLDRYEDLDLRVREYEDIVESAVIRLTSAIQTAIDIARGK
jgi:hypothetical protein